MCADSSIQIARQLLPLAGAQILGTAAHLMAAGSMFHRSGLRGGAHGHQHGNRPLEGPRGRMVVALGVVVAVMGATTTARSRSVYVVSFGTWAPPSSWRRSGRPVVVLLMAAVMQHVLDVAGCSGFRCAARTPRCLFAPAMSTPRVHAVGDS